MRKLFFCLLLIFYSSFSYSQTCSGAACVGDFGAGNCILPCNACAGGICWVVLPVNLISFEVKEKGGFPVVRWSTTAEKEVHKFQIEIGEENSEHVVIYSLLVEIAPEGKNLSDINNYSYTDFSFYTSPKNKYYRLKEIDNDGTEIILGVKAFNYVSGEEIAFAEASPVPFKEDIKVSFFTSVTTESEISLIDIYSQVHASIILQPGLHETTMNTQNLPAGIYFVLVRAGNSLKVIKVLKE